MNEALKGLSKEKLMELLEIYSKNWVAMDGLWFQAAEKDYGMDVAMDHDCRAWDAFTKIEARRLKDFLSLPERAGLDGLDQALRYRIYANVTTSEIIRTENSLTYRILDCRVQSARQRKGMPWHPCRRVGVIEYREFARVIDDRLSCQCLSCFPEITDQSCACSWQFNLSV